ncbi:MAG: hypothetical protein ACREPU_10335 [Rhodanobacteraceae bacterium]
MARSTTTITVRVPLVVAEKIGAASRAARMPATRWAAETLTRAAFDAAGASVAGRLAEQAREEIMRLAEQSSAREAALATLLREQLVTCDAATAQAAPPPPARRLADAMRRAGA